MYLLTDGGLESSNYAEIPLGIVNKYLRKYDSIRFDPWPVVERP